MRNQSITRLLVPVLACGLGLLAAGCQSSGPGSHTAQVERVGNVVFARVDVVGPVGGDCVVVLGGPATIPTTNVLHPDASGHAIDKIQTSAAVSTLSGRLLPIEEVTISADCGSGPRVSTYRFATGGRE